MNDVIPIFVYYRHIYLLVAKNFILPVFKVMLVSN
jgi:hypothetical protein